jgi:hypothetical protein
VRVTEPGLPAIIDMGYAPIAEYNAGRIVGQFVLSEHGRVFEYSLPEDVERPFGEDFDKRIWVGDGTYRWARILATVAYVTVDEGEVEKWHLRRHHVYG